MSMPKPHKKHERLKDLVGEWSGPETIHPAPWDPAGGTADARIVNRHILDGFGVVQEYEQTRGGGVNFKGHGVFWYDETAQEYVMTWWDSIGGSGAHYRGQWDGDRLVLRSPMPQGGHARAAFDVGTPGQYAFLMEISNDGDAWMPAMEGTYRRHAAAKTAAPAVRKAKPAAKRAKRPTTAAARKPAVKAKAVKPATRKAAPRKKAAPTKARRR